VVRENEFYLHIKLGDLVGKVSSISSSSPVGCSSSKINEQAKNDQRKHYDQAYHLLKPHLETCTLSSTDVLFMDLAERYAFIDWPKSEELFLEVMKIIEKYYGPGSINELAASILIKLAWVKREQNKHIKALEFFDRSLRMEFEMHASNPFHEHISRNISFLACLFVSLECTCPYWEQLQTVKQQVLTFLGHDNQDEGSTNSVEKADCLMHMAYVCVYSEDYEKAEKLNHIAVSIFAKAKENKSRQGVKLDIIICHLTDMILKYVKSRQTQNKPVTRKQVLDFGDTIDSLIPRNATSTLDKGILCSYCNTNDDLALKNESCTFLSEATKRVKLEELSEKITSPDLQKFSPSTDINVEKENLPTSDKRSEEVFQVNNNVTNARQSSRITLLPKERDRDSEDRSTSNSSRFSHGRPSNKTDENQEHFSDAQGLDAKVSLESDYHNVCLVAESILSDGNHRYLQHFHKSREYSFFSVVKSLSEKSSCVQSFIKEAENAKNNKNMFQMIVFLELASRRVLDPESKAKISRLIGECQLYLQSNRTATMSFSKAVDFYRSVSSTSELDHKVACAESLIGLAKSRMLCNDMKSALCACEEGVKLISSVQPQLTTSRLLVKMLYLAVKCTLQLNTTSTSLETFGQCLERCKRAVKEISDLNELCTSDDLELLFEISLLKASTSFHLSQQITELRKVKIFFETTADRLETLDMRDDDIIRHKRRLFSCLGRVLVMMGEMENAETPLTKSLAAFFVPVFTGMTLPLDEIITLLDAITATKAVTTQQESRSPFQETMKLCKDEFLKQNDNPLALLNFFRNMGNHYVDDGRTREAIFAYEAGLAVAEHMVLEPIDQINGRGEMLLLLANVHRLQAIENTGKGVEEESRLAEKYYKSEIGNGTEKSSIHKNIMYANFLCDESRFEEAIVVLKQVEEVSVTQWTRTVICLYSQRALYGAAIEKYIESHGELLTKMGVLACTSLYRAYIGLGDERKAAMENLRMRMYAKDLPASFICTTSCGFDLLSIYEKHFPRPVEEPGKLAFDEFLGSAIQLYYKPGEYEVTPKVYDVAISTASSSTNKKEFLDKLSNLRLSGNALVILGVGDKSYSYYGRFLEMLHQHEGILDKSFDEQLAILSQYTFPESFYVCQSLGMMLARQGKLDGAISCYELCLRRGSVCSIDQNFMATLSELYQTKALIEDKNDTVTYQLYMDLARGCFQKLLNKNKKMTPFFESTFASFLFRTEHFDEAISHFEQVLASETNDEISLSEVDLPLFGVQIAREIQARVEVYLPLKIHVYHQMVRAYFKCGKVEKARESLLQMEEYVKNFASSLHYPIIRSMLGYTYKETGNERKAMEILKTVLETEPDNVPVKLALEECTTIEQTTSNSD
jgi:tetratricopeptide (TPR) repeat protein